MKPRLESSFSIISKSDSNTILKMDNSTQQMIMKINEINKSQKKQSTVIKQNQISLENIIEKNTAGEQSQLSNSGLLSRDKMTSLANKINCSTHQTIQTHDQVEVILDDQSYIGQFNDNSYTSPKNYLNLNKTDQLLHNHTINQSSDLIIHSPNYILNYDQNSFNSPTSKTERITQYLQLQKDNHNNINNNNSVEKSNQYNNQKNISDNLNDSCNFSNMQQLSLQIQQQQQQQQQQHQQQRTRKKQQFEGQNSQDESIMDRQKQSNATGTLFNQDTNSIQHSKSQYTITDRQEQNQSDRMHPQIQQQLQRNSKNHQSLLKTKNDLILQVIKKLQNESSLSKRRTNNIKLGIDKKIHEDRSVRAYDSFQVTDLTQQLPIIQVSSNKNYLLVLLFVKKFINSILYSLASRDYRLLSEKHFSIVNDKSAVYNPQVNNYKETKNSLEAYQELRNKKGIQSRNRNINLISQLMIRGSVIIEYILKSCVFQFRVLQPNSLILIIWDILILFQLSLLFTIIPARFAFDIRGFSESQWQLFIYTIPLIVFLLDMFICFHSGYYEYGFPVLDKKQVVLKYFKNKFWSDFFSVILLFIDSSEFGYILTLVLRLNQVNIKVEKLNEHFQIQERFPTISDFTKLIIRVLYISHLFGCGFNFIGKVTKNDPLGCWLIKSNLLDKDWLDQYIYSIYFGIITMITIGYGDIYPINKYEKIYVIIMTFISCGLFAYCVNSIGEIIKQIKQKSEDFTQKKYILSTYLNHMNISNHTKIRFLKYTEYIHHTTDQLYIKVKFCYEIGQQIFDTCPQEMKEEVLKEYYGKKLQNYKTFKMNFSSQFLTSLSLRMKEQVIGPGESLILSGQKLSKLYFINKDSDLEYYYKNGEFHRQLCSFSTQSNHEVVDLGLFFSEQPAEISIRTKSSTAVSFIMKEDFLDAIKPYQNDYEIYSMMRNQFLSERRCDIKCNCCGKFSHSIGKCPLIHYTVRKETFTARLFHPFIQERNQNHIRMKKHTDDRFHALSLNHTVRHELKRIRLNYAQEQLNFFLSPDMIQTFQFHSKDKYFFTNVPQINLFIDDCQIQLNTAQKIQQNAMTQNGQQNINNQLTCYFYTSSSQQYTDDTDTESSYENDKNTSYSSKSNNLQINNINNNTNFNIVNNNNINNNHSNNALSNNKINEDITLDVTDISIYNNTPKNDRIRDLQIKRESQLAMQQKEGVQKDSTVETEENIRDENEGEKKHEPQDKTYVKQLRKESLQQQSLYSSHSQQSFVSNSISQFNLTIPDQPTNHDSISSPSNFQLNFNKIEKPKPVLTPQKRIDLDLQKKKSNLKSQQNKQPESPPAAVKKQKRKSSQKQQKYNITQSGDTRSKNSTLKNMNDSSFQDKESSMLWPSQNMIRKSLRMLNTDNMDDQMQDSKLQQMGAGGSGGGLIIHSALMYQELSGQEDKKERLRKMSTKNIQHNNNNRRTSLHDIMKTSKTQIDRLSQGGGNDQKSCQLVQQAIYDNEMSKHEGIISSHIFGVLEFEFDKFKEYQLFYPQYNYTNMIKRLKKINFLHQQNKQNKNTQNIKSKKVKN